jgi:hypothetical protein
VQESYTDAQGRRQTRTRVETGSTIVASGGESAPFYLRDATGAILVHPQDAEVRSARLFSQTCTPLNALYYEKGPPGAIMNSTFTRTFHESGIALHDALFLVGHARERQDIVAPEIAAEKTAPLYLVTVQSEEQVLRGYSWRLHIWSLLALAASGGGAWLLWEEWPRVFAALGICAGAWGLTWVWMLYNSLVDTRNRVRQGWSQLEVQLKRRYDLITPLMQTVGALATHERTTQEALAALRTQLQATPPGVSGPDFQGLRTVIAGVAERYPELKTNEAFAALHHSLIETEQRIALARAYYNDIATAYNTRIEVMPDALMAKLTGFRPVPLLVAAGFERAEVQVQFA